MASDTFDSDRLDAYIEESDKVLREVQVPAMIKHGIIPYKITERDTQDQYDGIDAKVWFHGFKTVDAKHRNKHAKGTDLNLEESGPGTHNWRESKTDIFFLSGWNKELQKYQHTAYYKRDLIAIVDEIGAGMVLNSNNGQMIRYIPTNHLWALDILGGTGQ